VQRRRLIFREDLQFLQLKKARLKRNVLVQLVRMQSEAIFLAASRLDEAIAKFAEGVIERLAKPMDGHARDVDEAAARAAPRDDQLDESFQSSVSQFDPLTVNVDLEVVLSAIAGQGKPR